MPLLPSSKRGLGFRPDPLKNGSPSFAKMGVAAASDVTAFSLEGSIPVVNGRRLILDQGSTSSCVAHAFVAALHIVEQRAGLAHIPASRLYVYYHARREEGRGSIVFDNGTYLRTCAEGLAKFGVPDERWWPFSTFSLTVNKRPKYEAISEAHPRQGGKYARIYEYDADRSQAIKSALVAGHPVCFGTLVSKSFLDSRGGAYVELPRAADPIVGGHAMTIVGWETRDKRTWYRVLNSWGPDWRDGGLCWMAEDYVTSVNTTDLHVIHGWERLREAE
jgi:hypothetical protein